MFLDRKGMFVNSVSLNYARNNLWHFFPLLFVLKTSNTEAIHSNYAKSMLMHCFSCIKKKVDLIVPYTLGAEIIYFDKNVLSKL